MPKLAFYFYFFYSINKVVDCTEIQANVVSVGGCANRELIIPGWDPFSKYPYNNILNIFFPKTIKIGLYTYTK